MELMIFGLCYLVLSSFMIVFCMIPPVREFMKRWSENRRQVEITIVQKTPRSAPPDPQLIYEQLARFLPLPQEEKQALIEHMQQPEEAPQRMRRTLGEKD